MCVIIYFKKFQKILFETFLHCKMDGLDLDSNVYRQIKAIKTYIQNHRDKVREAVDSL